MPNYYLCVFLLALEYLDAPLKDLEKIVKDFSNLRATANPVDDSTTFRDLLKKHMPSKVRDSSYTHMMGDGM